MEYAIHWFRRDLRVAGNSALKHSLARFDGRVLGLFCFDHKFLARKDFSANRFQFFLHTLQALKKELKSHGGDLLVLDVGPDHAFEDLLKKFKRHQIPHPQMVSFSRDYEPFALKRDKAISKWLEKKSIATESFRDHLLIEPNELVKKPGEGYQVYSPFARKWLEIFKSVRVQERLKEQKSALHYLEKKAEGSKTFKLQWKKLFKGEVPFKDKLDEYVQKNSKNITVSIPEAGSAAAFRALKNFSKHLPKYQVQRDIPALSATSKLSLYLKNGSITSSQIIAYLKLKPYIKKSSGADCFFSELIWREFYYHILARHPRVEKEAFLLPYRNLQWLNKKAWFNRWKEGNTGFPIVDAGMRELKETGWMHNRVRMIVASFLTKDLLIDWRWGERYFMEQLLDGDLAANNGGWQWAASTGCDPQPYFRIFNPWLQSKKFDPDGSYIKRFIPELEDVPSYKLHAPIENHMSYPRPMVDHSIQRNLALEMYKKL